MNRSSLGTLLAVVLSACSIGVEHDSPFDPNTPVTKQAKASLKGSVELEQGGDPREATVVVRWAGGQEQVKPAENGRFFLQGILPGPRTIEVDAPGYTATRTEIVLSIGEIRTLPPIEVKLKRVGVTGSVSVQSEGVVAESPAGTTVRLRRRVASAASAGRFGKSAETEETAALESSVVVSSSGEFQFSDVPAGEYDVSAEKPTTTLETAVVEVSGDGDVQIDTLVLKPLTGEVTIVDGAYVNQRTVQLELLGFNASEVQIGEVNGDSCSYSRVYEAFAVQKSYELADFDGEHVVCVRYRDENGRETRDYTRTVVLDRVAPTLVTAEFEQGDYTGGVNAVLALSANGADQVQISAVLPGNWNTVAWQPFVSRLSYPLLNTNAANTVYVRFGDLAGNVTGPETAVIVHDDVPPGTIANPVQLGYGAIATSSSKVHLALAATGASEMQLSEYASFSDAGWVPYSSEKWVDLSGGNGTKTLYVRFRDAVGNTTVAYSDTIQVDTAPITQPYIAIQGAVTSSTSITVQLAAGDPAVNEVMLSQDEGFSGGVWTPYAPFKPFTLTGVDGAKTVYAKFRKPSGLETDTVSDSVILDRAAPSYTAMQIDAGAFYAQSNIVVLGLTAVDDTSGVQSVVLSESPTFAGATAQPYALSVVFGLSAGDGPKTVYAKFIDRAGRESASISASITVDTANPSFSLLEIENSQGQAISLSNIANVVAHVVAADAAPLEMLLSSRADFAGAAWSAYTARTPWAATLPTNAAGELRTVWAKVRDAGGRESNSVSATFTLDTIGPTAYSLDIVPAAATSPTVAVNFTSAGADWIEISEDLSFATPVRFSARASTTVTLAAGEGLRTLWARFSDNAGNFTSPVADQVTLDKTAPALAAFSIDEGTATSSSLLHLSLSAIDAAQFQVAEGGVCGGTWQPMATQYAYLLTSTTEGTRDIALRYRDASGNATACITHSILYDATAPTFTGPNALTLAAGASFTIDRSVPVTFAVTGATELQISENPTFVGSAWSPFAPSTSWLLSAGDGTKTVYVRFRDAAGNTTTSQSAGIALDTAGPTFNAVVGAPVTSGTSVSLTLTATGADNMRFSIDPGFAGASWVSFASPASYVLPVTEGAHTIYVQLRDAAGNVSIVRSVTVLSDRTAPAAPNVTVLGGMYSKNESVSLQLLGEQAADMQIAQNALFTAAVWQPYSQLKSFTLTGGEGAKMLYVRVRDAAGNVSSSAAVAVVLDQTLPSVLTYNATDSGGATITTTNQLRFYLQLQVTDATPVTVQFSAVNAFSGAAVESLQASRPWDTQVPANPLGETRQVYARILDAAGNERIAGPLNVLVDTLGPTGPGLSLGASLITSPTVSASLSANNADFVELAEEVGFLNPLRFAYQAVTNYTFATGDGGKTLYARYADLNGNFSPIVAASVTLDQTPPQGAAFVIDQGVLTNLTTVQLTLTAVGATDMQVAENDCGGLWLPYDASYSHPFTSSVEGWKTVAVRFRDAAGNDTECKTRDIRLDRTAPFFTGANVVSINGDATSTTERAVTVSFAVTEATEMILSENPSFVGANWIPFTPTLGWVLSAGEGTKTLFVKFRDEARNETADKDDAITLILFTPAVSILQGAFTNNPLVSVQILANNATEVLMSELPGMGDASWVSYAAVKTFSLSPGDGLKTVYVRVRDGVGNISGRASASITIDQTAPWVILPNPVLINGDATSTTDRGVTLSFAVTQASEALISEDLNFTGANWIPFAPSASWVLSNGEGAKTVYAKFRDAAGNTTASYNDSIFIAPSTPSVSILGGMFTRFSNVQVQILSNNATEVLLSQYAPMTDATWQSFSSVKLFTLSGADGLKTVYVRVRDSIGNVSGQASATVTLDRVAPYVVSFAATDIFGTPISYSTQTRYYLAVTATDVSPIYAQYSAYNSFIGIITEELQAYRPWDAEPASTADGEIRSTFAKFTDGAGNVAYAGPVTVLVDNVGVAQASSAVQISPELVSSTTVNVTLFSQTAASVELSEDPFFTSPPPILIAMQPSTTYDFGPGDGLRVLWAKFRDSGGFPENPVSAATVVDTTYPQNVTFSIAEGAVASTLLIHVNSGTLGADQAQISDVACGNGAWVAFQTSLPFTFSSGVNGPRSIYVQYRDNVGHVTGCVAQPILLDTSRANITSISPQQGPAGSEITIYGTNIGQSVGSVVIGGIPAQIKAWTDTQIVAIVPLVLPAGPTTVVAYVDGNASPSFPYFVLPGITGLDTNVAYVGVQVRIFGGAFGATQGSSSVSAGGIEPFIVEWTNNYIDFIVPEGIGSKSQPIWVEVDGLTSNTVVLGIEPHVTMMTPITGPSGSVVTLTGTNFGFSQGTSSVLVNGKNAPVLSWSSTVINFSIEAATPAGWIPVKVVLGNYESADAYFEHIRPWIDDVYPSQVTTGETVWITGRYLEGAAGQVSFGGMPAPVSMWTSGSVAITVPAGVPLGYTSVQLTAASAATSNTRTIYVRADEEWVTLDTVYGREEHTLVWTGSQMLVWGGTSTNGYISDGYRYDPATDSWLRMSSSGEPSKRDYHTAVWTGSEMIIWGGIGSGGRYGDGGIYDPASDSWRPTSLNGAPTGRYGHSAVWTGSKMIVFGGEDTTFLYPSSGGIYDPVTDTWIDTPLVGAPVGRWRGLAVWTGNNMIVYGGEDYNTSDPIAEGARFSPSTMTWAPISLSNSPGEMHYFSMVWTGSEVIVWGGYNYNWIESKVGGRYNPGTDTWVSTNENVRERSDMVFAWTGTEMIVWSGCTTSTCYDQSGARYNPLTDAWTTISQYLPNVPAGRYDSAAVWSGEEFLVFGGYAGGYSGTGGRYNPLSNAWIALGQQQPPLRREGPSAVWTGSEMVIWGGVDSTSVSDTCWGRNDGSRYNPATNTWRPSLSSGLANRGYHSTVWTGTEMLVWGGYYRCGASTYYYHADGGRYNPASNTWSYLPVTTTITQRYNHTAVWTGDRMIVFGGYSSSAYLNTGASYYPLSGTWAALPTVNAPAIRSEHMAAWTGNEMLIWGGRSASALATGGRYVPSEDMWYAMPVTGAPAARYAASAAFTGSQWIIWGGRNTSATPLGDGSRYEVTTSTWYPVPATLANSPSIRFDAASVWTGSELIVWGGNPSAGVLGNGARLDPLTLIWTPMTTVNAPAARRRAAAVWTGREMIIWGGTLDNAELKTDTGSQYFP